MEMEKEYGEISSYLQENISTLFQKKTENERRIIKKATDISLDNRILSGGLVLLMDLFYCYSKNKSISKMTLPLHTRDPLQFCTFIIHIESIFFILNISKS